MGSFLGLIATLLVIAFGGAFAVPYIVDWDDYRSTFETQLERVIGRKVSVGGKVNLALLPVPQLSFETVRVANPGGSFEQPFAEMQSFDVELSLPALLSGKIEAKSVTLGRPHLRLAVNEAGRGNWTDIGTADPALPFVPRDVSLNAVVIEGGTVEIVNVKSRLALRLDGINGEFAAESLQGPFRFTGAAAVNGSPHEMRVNAGLLQAGVSRIKATIKTTATGAQYQFDGELNGFDGALTYQGPVTFKATYPQAAAPPDTAQQIEATAQALISPETIQLDNLSVTFGGDVRPQTLSGKAALHLGEAARLDAEIDTRWFDATPFMEGNGTAGLAAVALNALDAAIAALPVPAVSGRVKVTADQIGFGTDLVQNLELEIAREGDVIRLTKLQGIAPGDSSLTISGVWERPAAAGQTGAHRFTGKGELTGANLARFIRWAALNGEQTSLQLPPQNYALRAGLQFSGDEVRLDQVKGELGGSGFSGSFRYGFGGQRILDMSLDSDRLDLTGALGGSITWRDFIHGQTGTAKADARPPGAASDPAAAPPRPLAALIKHGLSGQETKLALRLGRLDLPGYEARDVKANLAVRDGTLDIGALQFATADGLRVTANGALKSFDKSPDGDIKLSIEAETAAALETLARLGGAQLPPQSLASAAPLKLAGNLAARGPASILDFKLDGLAADSPFSFAGRYEGAEDAFWRGAIDAEGWLSNTRADVLLRQLLVGQTLPEGKFDAGGQSLFSFAAKGPVAGTMDVNTSLRSPMLAGSFEGKAKIIKAVVEAQGTFRFDSASPPATKALLAPWLPQGLKLPKSVSLQASLDRTAGVYAFSGINARLDGLGLTGSARLGWSGDQPGLSLNLDAEEASLPALLSVLTETGSNPLQAAAEAATGLQFWPEQPFSQTLFTGPKQSLQLAARSLSLGEGLVLEDAVLAAELEKGTFTISKLEGRLFDGRLRARASLEREKGRFVLKSRGSLDEASLASIFPGQEKKPLADGRVSLDLRLSGSGFSPRGLVSTLSGSGRLSFSDGTIAAFDPAAPQEVFLRQIETSAYDETAFRRQLAKQLRSGSLNYRKFKAPVRVRNGILQIRRASFRNKDYTTRAIVAVDLSRMHADTELQIGIANSRKQVKLPPVTLVVAGPLAGIMAAKSDLDSSDLERLLAVKKMERDVETLEKLNKLGRLPVPKAAIDPEPGGGALGPRLKNAEPAQKTPAAKQPANLDVERRSLPPLLPDDAAVKPDNAYGWKPSSQNEQPLVIEKNPGSFETKIRSAIEAKDDAVKLAPVTGATQNPTARRDPQDQPGSVPPTPERKPAESQKPRIRAEPAPRDPFYPFSR